MSRRRTVYFLASLGLLGIATCIASCGGGGGSSHDDFAVRFLVSDGFVTAEQIDANLVNPWGLAANPTGDWWVANNHTSTSTPYDENGITQSVVVNIPGSPTGIVYNGGPGFVVSAGMNSSPARFLFASEDGTISAWSSSVPPPGPSSTAFVVVDESVMSANYKGLAIANGRLYAADFHNARVDVYDDQFQHVVLPAGFPAPSGSAGYAPFGIQAIGAEIFVAWALVNPITGDEVAGPGNGFVEVYDLDGNPVAEVAAHGALDAPWGIAGAPTDFGDRGAALLVGNFGDGRILRYERTANTFTFTGALEDASRQAIEIGGLWGIAFGAGPLSQTGPTNALFFAAGPGGEDHGSFGRIDPR